MGRNRGPRSSRPPARSAPAAEVTARVRIESIAAGGEGVGRLPDGRAVFVHRSAPGELVETRLIADRPRWARGQLTRVLEPSPDRRPAPCPHYDECGGCTLEHLIYPAQLEAKARIVQDALERIGGLVTPAPKVVPSPNEYHYRNRVSFAVRRLPGGRVIAGFHALHNPDRIVQIDGSCLLPEAPIGAVWDRMRSLWGPGADLLPSGERLRLTLRSTAGGQVSLVVEGGNDSGDLPELVDRVEGLDSAWHRPEVGALIHAAGAPGLPESWGEESFDVAGSAFLQVNRGAAARLEEHVLRIAGPVPGLKVVDAYCGIGLHGRRLSRAGAHVVGLELDADAVAVAIASSATRSGDQGAGSITYVCGRVEEHLADALPADLVILNPPRAGVDEAVIAQILASPPARIIYISCDPATLSRDVRRLEGAFELDHLLCFDLFPQTAHVETVMTLRRRDGER